MNTSWTSVALVAYFFLGLSANRVSAAEDLEGAFAALKKTMGAAPVVQVNSELDEALDKAFNPVPEILDRPSAVPIDKITPEASLQAVRSLSKAMQSTVTPFEFRMDKAGRMVTLALWAQSETLKKLFQTIVTKLYSDNDSKNFKLVVTSSPMPSMRAKPIDFNDELRAEKIAEAEREINSRFSFATPSERVTLQKEEILKKATLPARPGVEITMSAGMFATFKNIDEFAGQIALVLARLNPGLFGVTQDPYFLRNQNIIKLIQDAVESGSEDSKDEVLRRKEEIYAELSAMERLMKAEFSPWAITYYEEHVIGWLSDEFIKSKKHSPGRALIRLDNVNLVDWSRPLRLQIQDHYMRHLQSVPRGTGMELKEKQFPLALKILRFRMAAFTRPFFWGVHKQAGSIVLAGGAAATYFYFPEIVHWTMSALHLTSGPSMQETIRHSWSLSEGFKSIKDFGANLLEAGYLSGKFSSAGAAIFDHFGRFYEYYGYGLLAGTTVLVTRFLKNEGANINRSFYSMYQSFLLHQKAPTRTAQNVTPPQVFDGVEGSAGVAPIVVIDEADLVAEGKPQEFVEAIGGSTQMQTDWGARLGKKMAEILQAMPTAHIILKNKSQNAYEKATHLFEAKLESNKQKVRLFANESKEKSAAFYSGTKVFLYNRQQQAIRLGSATLAGSLAAGIAVGHGFAAGYRGTLSGIDRAAVYGKRRGSDTWVKVNDLSSKASQRSLEFMRDVLDATPGASKSGSRFAIRIASSSAQWLFVEVPKNGLSRSFQILSSVGDRINKAIEESHESRRRFQEKIREDANYLNEGVLRRQKFFSSSNLSLNEIQQALEEFITIFLQRNLREDFSSEYWGVKESERSKRSSITEYLFPIITKWLNQEKVTAASEVDFSNLFYAMTLIFNHIDSGLRAGHEFSSLTSSIYDRLKERNLPGINAMLAAAEQEKELSFLHAMATRGAVRDARKDLDGALLVRATIQAVGEIKTSIVSEAITGNERAVFSYLSAPEVTLEQYAAFISSILNSNKVNMAQKIRAMYRVKSALQDLSPIRRAKLLSFNERLRKNNKSEFSKKKKREYDDNFETLIYGKGSVDLLKKAREDVVKGWIGKASSISELQTLVVSTSKEYNIWPNDFQYELQEGIEKNLNLIRDKDDIEKLFASEFFWSEAKTRAETSVLEAPLQRLLEKNRERYANNPAWKYDPIQAERLHKKIKMRMLELGIFPNDFEGQLKVFQHFTMRGVSTVSDDLLGSILKLGTPEQIQNIEDFAVRQGRVFEQSLKDLFSIRGIEKSDAYQQLFANKNATAAQRMEHLKAIVQLAQEYMTDLGLSYVEFLEKLSVRIGSSYDEAEFLQNAKGERIVQRVKEAMAEESSDIRMKVLTEILPEIKKWDAKEQFHFLLYLRGSEKNATPFVESKFPTFGPERVRQMFQSLPLEAGMAVVNLFLRETLLARKNVNEGYGKKLIEHLVKSGADTEAQSYVSLMLDALLVGIQEAGNIRFQTHVLSALVAMRAGENRSMGETMKLILEQFPGVGPKIGQFLVGTGLLPDEMNRVLIGTQDSTLPPGRFDIFSDIASIVGRGKDIGITIGESLGSGSIKYSVKGEVLGSGDPVALQIFRDNVQNGADFQIAILNGMIPHLIKRDGKKWAFLQVIVDGAMNAVQREKNFRREGSKTFVARRLYSGFNEADFTIAVPEQELINQRLLVSRFAKGGNFLKMIEQKKIDAQDIKKIGLKLLEMESEILYGTKNKKGVIWYDTDRHAGNYLINVESRDGKKHYTIAPIDFGQMTYIRVGQRDKVAELFAMATALGTLGANEWISKKVAELVGLNPNLAKKLTTVLREVFPMQGQSKEIPVKHYFSLIGAINETLRGEPASAMPSEAKNGKMDIVYTDFIRAIIQLNQYEKELEGKGVGIPKEARTPRKILESRAKDHLAGILREYPLEARQKVLLAAKNTESWFNALRKGEKFEPINFRLTREQLEGMRGMGGVSRVQAKTGTALPMRECRRIFQ